MIIKVCGMGDTKRMYEIALMGIHMLGFIFYPRSPRYVVGKIAPSDMESLPPSIHKVGVFVNTNEETIIKEAKKYHLDALQLHGSESPELCQTLKEKGFIILKAFNLTKKNYYEAYQPYCDFFIFDTPSEQHGGTGEKFDWTLLNTYQGETPFLLSGGIGPNDVEEVLKVNHPKLVGIDINSKFEIEPGIKDLSSVSLFINETKNYKL